MPFALLKNRYILCIFYFFFTLAFLNPLEGVTSSSLLSNDNLLSQNFQRGPPVYMEGYYDFSNNPLEALRKRNAELNLQVKALSYYREQSYLLQKRLDDLEQKYTDAFNRNNQLQAQVNQFNIQFIALTHELTTCKSQLIDSYQWINQAKTQKQLFENEQKNASKVLNETLTKTKKTNEEFQQLQLAFNNCEDELRKAQDRIEELQQLQQKNLNNSEQVIWLNEQIQAKNKKIGELNNQLDQLDRQHYTLKRAKALSDQKLEEKIKQLDALDQVRLQILKDNAQKEKKLQIEIDEKISSISDWRKEYELLKSQRDEAISINNELRQQNAELEAKCK